ncbi:high nitrogen upregulated cytochrome P450 monooxygenase 2 [Pilatotrama ljubarskyi]|nr:high nitrogen upregulated cytochrome P450 monooxygenase 2 [Pilatotrama ljubarskyi]
MASDKDPSPPSTASAQPMVVTAICLALSRLEAYRSQVAHQIFKRYETYSISFQLSLLLLPPALALTLQPTKSVLRAICVSLGTYLGTLGLAVLAHRASPLHPLARFPGPFVCRFSKFWMARIGYSGRQYLYVQHLHERYGNIVRIGPNELSVKDPSLIHPVCGASGLPHGPMYIGRLLTTKLPLVGIMDTVEHLERRKPWARAFTPAALKEYHPMLAARASQLVQALSQQGGEVDIAKWINYFSYDFMTDMAFGGGSELIRDGDVNNVWHILDDSLPAATCVSHVPWLGPYLGSIPLLTAGQTRLLFYCKQAVIERLSRGTQYKDIFHYLNEEDQPDRPSPPISRLVDDGVVAIVAGADTTSSTLTSIMFCLLTHPEAYKRLQEEIDRFYPPGDDPCDMKYHLEMHYLTAVINEGMRVYAPVPSGVQRLVPHRSPGVSLHSTYIPAGTAVWMPFHAMQYDPRNFSPRTADFWPERWLLASRHMSFVEAGIDEASFVHNESAFIPFSHGPMNCVGKALAMQEMRVVLCALLQKYELTLREEWDPRSYSEGYKDYLVTTRPPVPVVLHTR